MKMRAAGKEDFPQICRLVKNREELFYIYPGGRFPLTVGQLQQLAQRRQALSVVVVGDEVKGFADLYGLRPEKWAFIGNVIIDEACRGQGMGRQLLEYMLDQVFGAYALPEARISVFNHNSAALLLYTQLGFEPYGIEPREDPHKKRVALIHLRKRRSV